MLKRLETIGIRCFMTTMTFHITDLPHKRASAIKRRVDPMPRENGGEVSKRFEATLPGSIAAVPHFESAIGGGGGSQRVGVGTPAVIGAAGSTQRPVTGGVRIGGDTRLVG